MSLVQRIIIAVILVLLDLVIFFAPLGSIFIAYVLIANPKWVRDFLVKSVDFGTKVR